jgi:AMP phosphorylase
MEIVFRVKKLDVESGHSSVVVMNRQNARDMNLHLDDRVEVFWKGRRFIAVLQLADKTILPGEIGFMREVWDDCGFRLPKEVHVQPVVKPDSVQYIKRRLFGTPLKKGEIRQIVFDLMENKLSSVESSYFVASAYVQRLSFEEEEALTKAIVDAGNKIKFSKKPIMDKHCIGGVPGNRTTPIVVPIVAAAGLMVPKTSSRAITSPAGTADVMEAICRVDYQADELKKLVNEVGAAMVWGGALDLAPVDDILLKLRYPLRLDPVAFLLSSIMAKKKAVGSDKVLIDIPMGAKVKDAASAKNLASRFKYLGDKMGMEVRALVTDGFQPIGSGVGPLLEAIDCIEVLRGKGPEDLREKSVGLAGEMLAMAGRRNPHGLAKKLLESGKAYKKFKEILEAQEGDPNIKPKDLPVGEYAVEYTLKEDQKYLYYDSEAIAKVARLAGAPGIKGAGVKLLYPPSSKVKEGKVVLKVFTPVDTRVKAIEEFLKKDDPLVSREMVIETY